MHFASYVTNDDDATHAQPAGQPNRLLQDSIDWLGCWQEDSRWSVIQYFAVSPTGEAPAFQLDDRKSLSPAIQTEIIY